MVVRFSHDKEMSDVIEGMDSYCGLCCETCEFRESMNCGGCIATGGKPFHGACEIAECAKKKGK